MPSDDTLRFLSQPESHQAQVLVDTGPFSAKRDLRVGLEAAGVEVARSAVTQRFGEGSAKMMEELFCRATERVKSGPCPELLGRLDADAMVDRLPHLLEHRGEGLGLRNRSRESIEQKAARGVIAANYSLLDEANDDFVRNKIPTVRKQASADPAVLKV